MFDFVAYSTGENYKVLTSVWRESLERVSSIQKKVYLTEKTHSATYAQAIQEKIENLIKHEPSRGSCFIVSSDCDICFYEGGDWEGLVDFVAKSPRKIFFMRDCCPTNLNGGFYIIKRDYFEHYKGFLRRMIDHGISEYYYIDQCYINEHRDELDWEFIPDEYIMCGANWRWDLGRVCLYHAIAVESCTGDNVLDKLAAIHRYGPGQRTKPKVSRHILGSAASDCELVVAKYKENTEWTLRFCENVRMYDKGPLGTVPNIGRESHTYLTYILENYDKLPSKVYFSQGWIQDHYPHLNSFDEIQPKLGYLDDHMSEVKLLRVYPRERMDIKTWFKKYVDPEDRVDLTQKVYIWWGAIFPVTRNHILSRSKEYYQMLLDLIPKTSNPEVGHYFERSWYYIFNLKNNHTK